MRGTAAALILLLLLAGPVKSDPGVEGAVAGAWFPRNHSDQLHDIAHQRAFEVSQPGQWGHFGQRDGTAEVLAYNVGYADPLGTAILGWLASDSHDRILSNPEFRDIGCAEYFDGVTHWFACVLCWGEPAPAPVQPPQQAPPPTPAPLAPLPNTALSPLRRVLAPILAVPAVVVQPRPHGVLRAAE